MKQKANSFFCAKKIEILKQCCNYVLLEKSYTGNKAFKKFIDYKCIFAILYQEYKQLYYVIISWWVQTNIANFRFSNRFLLWSLTLSLCALRNDGIKCIPYLSQAYIKKIIPFSRIVILKYNCSFVFSVSLRRSRLTYAAFSSSKTNSLVVESWLLDWPFDFSKPAVTDLTVRSILLNCQGQLTR